MEAPPIPEDLIQELREKASKLALDAEKIAAAMKVEEEAAHDLAVFREIAGYHGGKLAGRGRPSRRTPWDWKPAPPRRNVLAATIGLSPRTYQNGKFVIRDFARGKAPLGEFYLTGEFTTDFAQRACRGLSVEEQNVIVRTIKHTRKARREGLAVKLMKEALAAKKNSQAGSTPTS